MKITRLFTFTKSIAVVVLPPILATATTMSFLSPARADDYSFDAAFTSTGCPGNTWQYTIDENGFNNEYIKSSGNTSCGKADWYISGPPTNQTCKWWVFVPSSYGNANAIPGLFNTSGKKYYGITIDENKYTDQFAYIGTFSNINHVNIGSNNGQTGTYIGLGTDHSLLATECH